MNIRQGGKKINISQRNVINLIWNFVKVLILSEDLWNGKTLQTMYVAK